MKISKNNCRTEHLYLQNRNNFYLDNCTPTVNKNRTRKFSYTNCRSKCLPLYQKIIVGDNCASQIFLLGFG